MNVRADNKHGALIGVGLGPGDPELVTVKAARLIGEAGVVSYFAKRGRKSHARRIAERYLREGCEELPLLYPVTTAEAGAIEVVAADDAVLLAQQHEVVEVVRSGDAGASRRE